MGDPGHFLSKEGQLFDSTRKKTFLQVLAWTLLLLPAAPRATQPDFHKKNQVIPSELTGYPLADKEQTRAFEGGGSSRRAARRETPASIRGMQKTPVNSIS
jgi:hypothetical protein